MPNSTFPGGSFNQYPPHPPLKRALPPPGAPHIPKRVIKPECNIPDCQDEGFPSDLGSNYCKEHQRRYELFVMGVLPSTGSTTMTETMFAMFDYLMEEIDKLNTEIAMYRITKQYTGEECGDSGADSPDARHRYARKSGKLSRRFKGL